MKLSQMGIGRNKVSNIDPQFPVQDLLSKTGQISQFSSGIYGYDNIPFLVKNRIKEIISKELSKVGCVEVSLPVLQPESIWEQSGRLQKYVEDEVIFRTVTNKGNYCLAPTAEEAMVEFARNRLSSYKVLPVTFFQIGEKFRNELRTRGYLLRGKSFEMMDAYSFNKDSAELNETYEQIKQAYFAVFEKLGMKAITVGADSGSIGGSKSEEFMILSSLGEDTILLDKNSGKAINTELLEMENATEYLKTTYGINDISQLEPKKSLELGHIFQLGTKYSETMNATYTASDGSQVPFEMGCYGIGVSRVLAAVYEKSIIFDHKNEFAGYSLPINLAPYLLQIIPKKDDQAKVYEAISIYNFFVQNEVPILLDDRMDVSIGAKIKDTRYMGTPYIAVFGSKTKENEVEVENTKTGETVVVSTEQFVSTFIELERTRKYDVDATFESILKKNSFYRELETEETTSVKFGR